MEDTPAPAHVRRLAWAVLAYNLLVIAWGAFVRASGSGAGCGRHWPLCNGEVVPRPKSIETVIELSHRVTSGLALVAVVALLVVARRALPRGHRIRRGAAFATLFVVAEALIGAGLVLFELVAHDASAKRALSMILHLGNTFLLLAALALTAHWATRPPQGPVRPDLPGEWIVRSVGALALTAVLALGATGAVAALGDTLFPVRSLAEGFAQDASPLAHAFVRLRAVHPFFALVTSALVASALGVLRVARPAPRVKRLSLAVAAAFVTQLVVGVTNLVLLVPIWLQLVHLLVADAVWISLVLFVWEATFGDGRTEPVQPPIMSRNGPGPSSEVPPSTSKVVPVTYAPAGDTR